MKKFGFPVLFIHWILECISSSKFSVLVNGSPYGFFGAKRGIRQGCPMSPYLFVMVMEVLSALLKKQVNSGSFGLHPKCKLTQLSHLCFADDVLVFFKGNIAAAQVLGKVLLDFSNFSGLVINCKKTSLYSSAMGEDTLKGIITSLNCSIRSLPVKYLGVPLISTKFSYNDYLPLIEMVTKRVKSWKGVHLAFVGRLMLIRHVHSGMVYFWFSCFVLPKRVIKELNTIF